MKKPKEKYITETYFDQKLDEKFAIFKIEIKTEIKYELKSFFEDIFLRHMTVLREGFRDDIRIALDHIKGVERRADNHETRLVALEEFN